jgi:hypothetical protein
MRYAFGPGGGEALPEIWFVLLGGDCISCLGRQGRGWPFVAERLIRKGFLAIYRMNCRRCRNEYPGEIAAGPS